MAIKRSSPGIGVRRLAIVGATVSMILAMGACSSQPENAASENGRTIVRLSWATSDLAPTLLGVDEGIFEKHDLDIKLSEAAPADLVGGLLSKKADLGANSGPGTVLAVGKDVPIVAVAGVTTFEAGTSGSSGSALLVPKASDIDSPADLEGRKVGVNVLASASEYAVRNVVAQDGGDPAKTSIVEVPFASMADTLRSGDIDAALVSEPFLGPALDSGEFEVPFGDPTANTFGDSPRLMVTATREYAETNPEVIDNFRAAVTESLQLATDSPDLLLPIFEKYYGMTKEQAELTPLNRLKADLGADDFDKINSILVEYGALEDPVPTAELVP